jgi:hypothetical protein
MKENKTTNIIFRISPKCKEELLMLANRAKCNSISRYLNMTIALETQKMIHEMAGEEAAKKAAKELGIPEQVGLVLRTTGDDDRVAVLGEKRAIRFNEIMISELKVLECLKHYADFVVETGKVSE